LSIGRWQHVQVDLDEAVLTEMGAAVYHRIYGEEIELIIIVELWIMWVTEKLSR
jgi:hypothetical protein